MYNTEQQKKAPLFGACNWRVLWQVRVLRSLFPSWLLPLFKQLVSPLGDGKPAAMLCGNSQSTNPLLDFIRDIRLLLLLR